MRRNLDWNRIATFCFVLFRFVFFFFYKSHKWVCLSLVAYSLMGDHSISYFACADIGICASVCILTPSHFERQTINSHYRRLIKTRRRKNIDFYCCCRLMRFSFRQIFFIVRLLWIMYYCIQSVYMHYLFIFFLDSVNLSNQCMSTNSLPTSIRPSALLLLLYLAEQAATNVFRLLRVYAFFMSFFLHLHVHRYLYCIQFNAYLASVSILLKILYLPNATTVYMYYT